MTGGAGSGRFPESKEGRAGNNVITSHSISFEVLDGKQVQDFLTRLNRRDVEKESANKALGFLARALDDDFVNAYCQAQADPEAKRYQELVWDNEGGLAVYGLRVHDDGGRWLDMASPDFGALFVRASA